MESDSNDPARGIAGGGGAVTDRSVVGYVQSSGVRASVLRAVERGATATDEILSDVDASESAVYNALNGLERRGLVRSDDGSRRLTGSGQIVADVLAQNEAVCDLLSHEYWETHDASALPQRFRLGLAALSNAEILEADDTSPYQIVSEVLERVESASVVDVVTPIYQPEFASAMPDSEQARLIVDEEVIERALDDSDDAAETRSYEETEIRVADVDVAFGVTENSLMLSLPTLEGSYDSRAEIIAECDHAIAWGRDLFEHYWERATPRREFVAGRRD